ncbi:MAG: ribonuclease P [Candidatus Micrarchaeota archaeon]
MNADEIARERIRKLLRLAREALDEDEKLSKRYVDLAKRIAMRHRIKLGNKLFCKKCGIVFVQGKTLRVRVSNKIPVYVCVTCSAARKISGRATFRT